MYIYVYKYIQQHPLVQIFTKSRAARFTTQNDYNSDFRECLCRLAQSKVSAATPFNTFFVYLKTPYDTFFDTSEGVVGRLKTC